MSNIIFPAGFIVDYTKLNLEMMQYYANMWNLEHTKMAKGYFEGSIFGIHTPRMQFGTVHFSHSSMSRGGFPDGCIVLIYSSSEASYSFQNSSISPYEVIMLTKGDEIDYLTSGDIKTYTIVIEEQLFYKELYDFFGDIPPSALYNKRLIIKQSMISLFHNTVLLWKNYLTNELPKITSTAHYCKIESTILRELFNCLVFTESVKKRKKLEAKTVRDLLHEKMVQDIDIPALTRELYVSESQLHHIFKTAYHMTPKKYLQNLRLNAIRKELLLAHPHTVTIRDIAMKYNYFHMSNFIQEYKKLFLELPSETLCQK